MFRLKFIYFCFMESDLRYLGKNLNVCEELQCNSSNKYEIAGSQYKSENIYFYRSKKNIADFRGNEKIT